LRIIVHDKLGTTKTGVAGGIFKGISDTAVEKTNRTCQGPGIWTETLTNNSPKVAKSSNKSGIICD